jgi:hypothetical protein
MWDLGVPVEMNSAYEVLRNRAMDESFEGQRRKWKSYQLIYAFSQRFFQRNLLLLIV